jgi:two-component system chemotaxis sensor kinase CheA
MVDPYRYFRIEARELIDELIAGLAGLGRGESATDLVGGLLRHTHTLKGAARVVGLPGIADHTHALEGLLEPFRAVATGVPSETLEEMLGLIDEIGDLLRALAIDEAPGPEPATVVAPTVPAPRAEAVAEVGPEMVRTARASLAEIDAVIDGVGHSRTQLSALRDALAQGNQAFGKVEFSDDQRESLGAVRRAVDTCIDRMERELRTVYDVAERLRLVPVTSIVPDLEGAARDVAAAQGKRVHLEVGGGQLRLCWPPSREHCDRSSAMRSRTGSNRPRTGWRPANRPAAGSAYRSARTPGRWCSAVPTTAGGSTWTRSGAN